MSRAKPGKGQADADLQAALDAVGRVLEHAHGLPESDAPRTWFFTAAIDVRRAAEGEALLPAATREERYPAFALSAAQDLEYAVQAHRAGADPVLALMSAMRFVGESRGLAIWGRDALRSRQKPNSRTATFRELREAMPDASAAEVNRAFADRGNVPLDPREARRVTREAREARKTAK